MEDTDKSKEELVIQLLERVKANKHTTVERILNVDAYRGANLYLKAVGKVGDMFKKHADLYYRTYLQKLEEGIDDISLLLDYNLATKAMKFYYDETAIVVEPINEYLRYLANPINLFKAYILGETREELDE